MPSSIVAAGHRLTAESAAAILRSGGNAFDAAIGALFTACVCEPALSSLGGGGFLMAHPRDGKPVLVDFFTQTPATSKAEDEISVDSFVCDFGSAQQVFHIGAGTSAVPGCVKGAFETARRFGTMPMRELIQPVCDALAHGVEITSAQAYLLSILTPIFMSPSASEFYASKRQCGVPAGAGERIYMPEYVDLLESLACEGDDLFYRGEVAKTLDELSRNRGGVVTRQDMTEYQAIFREPLKINYRNHRLLLNPAPSVGGIRIGMALKVLEQAQPELGRFGSALHLRAVLDGLKRISVLDSVQSHEQAGIDAALFDAYRDIKMQWQQAYRGTTHISVIDKYGNAAALTTSNGEGCGVMIPGTGIMLNNMLGEDDLNPDGLSKWPVNRRLSSMMCPSIAINRESMVVTGSGGSNRIPSAIQQVLTNLIEFDMTTEQAVRAPRLHVYDGTAFAEDFFEPPALEQALAEHDEHVLFSQRNVFFGGVHTVQKKGGQLDGAGDERRAGHCVFVA